MGGPSESRSQPQEHRQSSCSYLSIYPCRRRLRHFKPYKSSSLLEPKIPTDSILADQTHRLPRVSSISIQQCWVDSGATILDGKRDPGNERLGPTQQTGRRDGRRNTHSKHSKHSKGRLDTSSLFYRSTVPQFHQERLLIGVTAVNDHLHQRHRDS